MLQVDRRPGNECWAVLTIAPSSREIENSMDIGQAKEAFRFVSRGNSGCGKSAV